LAILVVSCHRKLLDSLLGRRVLNSRDCLLGVRHSFVLFIMLVTVRIVSGWDLVFGVEVGLVLGLHCELPLDPLDIEC